MKTILLITLTLFPQLTWGQINSFKGTCCDNKGKPTKSEDLTTNVYIVKKHKSKTPIEVNIKSVTLGVKTVMVDISYKDVIDYETPLININDTVAIKLVLGKTTENNINKYLYKLLVYKHETKSNCWKTLTAFNAFYEVYSQTMTLSKVAVSYGNADYFQIQEGWIKLN